MRPQLHALIEEAYQVFGDYRVCHSLSVCHMTEADERDIPADLLAEYTDRTYFHSAYLEDHREAADTIGAFLMRPEVTQRIEAAFFQIEDPRLQQLVSDALWTG